MRLLKPTWLIKSVTQMTSSDLKKQHIETVFLDVDNTLVAWNDLSNNEQMKTWVQQLRLDGLQVIALSNNTTRHVAKAVEPFGISFVANAKKPFLWGIRKAMVCTRANPQTSIVIGDQLFTDIIVGNRLGMKTVLVKSLGEKDMLATRLIRYVERQVLAYVCRKYQLDWQDRIGKF